MKNIAFIVHSVAGTKTKNRITKLIRELLDKEQFSPTVVATEYLGHATQLAHHFALEGYYAVVAVGDDEIVNEVANGLRNSNTALGVVPNGENNTFARHLDISTRMNRAIEMLNTSEVINIDYCTINNRPFFSACNIGFDTIVSNNSNNIKDYAEEISKELIQHKSGTYLLKLNDVSIKTSAFFITFANANQWGNDTSFAPKASMQDGWIDIAIVNEVPIIENLACQSFTKNINENLYVHTIREKELIIVQEKEQSSIYIDGSSTKIEKELIIRLVEDGLKVLVKKRF
jgi:diacylglycerol kinase family enzyme